MLQNEMFDDVLADDANQIMDIGKIRSKTTSPKLQSTLLHGSHIYYNDDMQINTRKSKSSKYKQKIDKIAIFRSKSTSPKLQSPLFTNNVYYTHQGEEVDLIFLDVRSGSGCTSLKIIDNIIIVNKQLKKNLSEGNINLFFNNSYKLEDKPSLRPSLSTNQQNIKRRKSLSDLINTKNFGQTSI